MICYVFLFMKSKFVGKFCNIFVIYKKGIIFIIKCIIIINNMKFYYQNDYNDNCYVY